MSTSDWKMMLSTITEGLGSFLLEVGWLTLCLYLAISSVIFSRECKNRFLYLEYSLFSVNTNSSYIVLDIEMDTYGSACLAWSESFRLKSDWKINFHEVSGPLVLECSSITTEWGPECFAKRAYSCLPWSDGYRDWSRWSNNDGL